MGNLGEGWVVMNSWKERWAVGRRAWRVAARVGSHVGLRCTFWRQSHVPLAAHADSRFVAWSA